MCIINHTELLRDKFNIIFVYFPSLLSSFPFVGKVPKNCGASNKTDPILYTTSVLFTRLRDRPLGKKERPLATAPLFWKRWVGIVFTTLRATSASGWDKRRSQCARTKHDQQSLWQRQLCTISMAFEDCWVW